MSRSQEALETVEAAIASDNVVTLPYSLSGTNDGECFGQPATGKRFEVHNGTVLEVVERKVGRVWRDSDTQGLMRQLGLGG